MHRIGMKTLPYVLMFLSGVGLTYFFISYDVINGPSALPSAATGPVLNISYADFVSIMLTAVTIVLAAVAVAVGIVAFRTVREIKSDARSAVKKEVEDSMQDVSNRIEETVAQIMYRTGNKSGQEGELEREFDPVDSGER